MTRQPWPAFRLPASANWRFRRTLPRPLRRNPGGEPTPRLPVRDDGQLPRLQRVAEVVANPVRRRLEEDALVAIGVEVELERLQFDAGLVRDVADRDARKIRMPRHRTHGREL